MTAGQIIGDRRRKAGMTQEELAEKLGVTRQAVSKWEQDLSYPETEKIVELCKLFSLSADELLLGKESEEAPKAKGGAHSCGPWHYEYVSERTLFGLPLVHINIGFGIYRAKGIVAIGNIATGWIALGGLAAGFLSIGGLAVGLLLTLGGVAVGGIALGGVALGGIAIGGVAVGYFSVGGLAVGQIALGGWAQGYLAVGGTKAYGVHSFVMSVGGRGLCAVAAVCHRRNVSVYRRSDFDHRKIFGDITERTDSYHKV